MPTYTKKTGKGKLVIINLQATKHDKKADLIIRNYADKIFQALFEKLKMKIPEYDTDVDPVMKVRSGSPSVIGPDFVFKIFSQSSQKPSIRDTRSKYNDKLCQHVTGH